jgi:transposase
MSRHIARLEARLEGLLQRTGRLEEKVEGLENENAALRAESRKLRRENRKLRDENRWLRREVRRLGGNLKPPEDQAKTDGDAGEEDREARLEQRPRSGKKRKRGGQPGHKPHNRELLPPEKVDEFRDLKPQKCKKCGTTLKGEDPNPLRHQVFEVPEPKAHVTEVRRHSLWCTCCGTLNLAPLPEGVPEGSFGPRLRALVGLLTGAYRMSKRAAQEFLEDICGVSMSLGSVSACEKAVSEALAEPVEEAHEFAKRQPVKNADETGWRERNKKAYLWTLVTSFVTIFMIRARRTERVARELLGGTVGVLGSDRLRSYLFWPVHRQQFCWAHLERRFEEFLLSEPESKRVGEGLLAETRRLFELWYRVRDGTLKHSSLRTYMAPVRSRVKALLQEGTACPDTEIAGTCRELLAHEPALWTFVRVPGVEPTNNAAERALRHGVLFRRVSFGTQSAEGSRFVERILTVRASLRQQGRNVVKFVIAACTAAVTGQPPPSLLPKAALDTAA